MLLINFGRSSCGSVAPVAVQLGGGAVELSAGRMGSGGGYLRTEGGPEVSRAWLSDKAAETLSKTDLSNMEVWCDALTFHHRPHPHHP